MNDELELTVYTDAAELVEVASNEAMEIISLSLKGKGVCHIALTGGTLGVDFARSLVNKLNNSADLKGLNIWFSDERFVVADSPLRNSRTVLDQLQSSSVTVHAVRSPDGGLTVQAAAALYESELGEIKMDICILGLGPDGHVASLFPNHWDPTTLARVVAVVDSPKPPSARVSFSMAFINSSAQVWIIAAGVAKAVAVAQVLEGDQLVPAGHVMASQLTRLIVDSEAFFTE